MSLLAPLFLVGLGLLALPIWLHRLQTDNPERESFASTMLLEQTQQRVHVRRKLQHLILMALRLLFLALLVFAFAKPAFQSDSPLLSPDASDRMHIMVVDTSASMLAESVFSDARAQVNEILGDAGAGDLLQLFRFGPTLFQLTEPTLDRRELTTALSTLEAAPVSADIGVMMAALSRLDWSQPLDYQIHIVSDLQKSALPDRYADMIADLPASAQISFNFYPVAGPTKPNWAIDSVREEANGLRIGVRGYDTPERSLELRVRLGDSQENRSTLLVPASGRASLFIAAPDYEAGVNAVAVDLLVDDQLATDNAFSLVVDRLPPEPVLLLTSNPFAPAATYLSAVMSSIGEVGVSGSNRADYRVQAVSLSDFDARTLERYSWLLIDDIGSIDASLATALVSYVESGGAIFAAAGDQALSLKTLPVFGQSLPAIDLTPSNRFHSVSQVDQSHVMLGELEGWSDLSFSRAIEIELLPDDQVLATLDNGTPLLIEQKRGQGKSLLLTSSLDNQWNDLPIKPLYVSLMTEIAAYLSESESIKTQLFAGETFSLREAAGGAGQLVDPQGNAVLALGNTNQLGAHLLDQTGFYEIYTATGENLVGVNVHPAESELTPMDDTEIERWQQALSGSAGIGEPELAEAMLTEQSAPQRELWFAILCIAALLLVAESLFANMQLNKRKAFSGVTA